MKVEKMARKQVWECPELQKLPMNWTSIKFPDINMEGVPDNDDMCIGPSSSTSPCNMDGLFFS